MVSGSCLCGTVRFVLEGDLSPIQFDHCSRCRKATGSAFASELVAQRSGLHWTQGEDRVRVYEAPIRERPPGYRRAFCDRCGGPVPIVYEQRVIVPVGTLDSDPGRRPTRHIFAGIKAPWFEIADSLPQFARNVPDEQRW